MKPQRHHQQQAQQGAHAHLLAGTPSRHDGDDAARTVTKGCATFWVGEEGEAPRRVAVPVARLGHPRMLELLGEAREEYGFAHQGAVVVPCAVERFMRAVEASASAGNNGHGTGTGTTITFACLTFTSPGALGRRTSLLRIHERDSLHEFFPFCFD